MVAALLDLAAGRVQFPDYLFGGAAQFNCILLDRAAGLLDAFQGAGSGPVESLRGLFHIGGQGAHLGR